MQKGQKDQEEYEKMDYWNMLQFMWDVVCLWSTMCGQERGHTAWRTPDVRIEV